MKFLRSISRIITGIVFIFSGTVKAIDPMGSAYKFQDYFDAFNLSFLKITSLPLAIILFSAEFVSGFALLTGYRQKTGIWIVMMLMLVFTPLTLVLAMTNPVSDCGCFGDAIHLTNWQTFFKNIIILPFAIILFTGRNRINTMLKPSQEWGVITVVTLILFIFSLINLKYLPLIDFLPYKTGVNIPEKMKIPEGKPADEYKTTFICEKNGIRKEFDVSNYPYDDSTWVFIDQVSVLVKKGYQPPIHDFVINAKGNTDITDKILNYEGYTLLMISRNTGKAAKQDLDKGFELGKHCSDNNIEFYVLTATGTDSIKYSYSDNNFEFCTGDEITLKTIIRANPGFVLLKKGTIIGKWAPSNLPGHNWFTGDITGKQIELLKNRTDALTLIAGALVIIIFLLLISYYLKSEQTRRHIV